MPSLQCDRIGCNRQQGETDRGKRNEQQEGEGNTPGLPRQQCRTDRDREADREPRRRLTLHAPHAPSLGLLHFQHTLRFEGVSGDATGAANY
ncbi:MAG TPA: hypothetical protein VFD32_07555 [Dehalococcoidia bacterium]|nr:hypothetical protein [Dehalococcoidia bacterium]